MGQAIRQITVHGREDFGFGLADVPCTALCHDDVHADLHYAAASESLDDYVVIWEETYRNVCSFISIADAPEAAPPSDSHFIATEQGIIPSRMVKRERRAIIVRWRFRDGNS